ncbi:hypothetical protein EJ03DRAFT_353911 [Teratosphaeria nubilosa]|uniref:Uncharacterized protein n=1 Tax=Teratosphaeria nubilosa TaxID=161662 RepID=A0A6G1L0U0_9PEZI|nr:hypothetical protein EJ03DRAFT_353911 [Teratosphaeria nubilosa]
MHALHLHGYIPLKDCDSTAQRPDTPRPSTTPEPHKRPKTRQRRHSLTLRRPSKHVPANPPPPPPPPPVIANAAAFAANSQHAKTEWGGICASVGSPTGFGTVTTITALRDEGRDGEGLRSPRSPLNSARLGELGGKVKAILGGGKGVGR